MPALGTSASHEAVREEHVGLRIIQLLDGFLNEFTFVIEFSEKFLMGFGAVMCVLLLGPTSTWHFAQKLNDTPVPDAFLEHLTFIGMLIGSMIALQWVQVWYRKRHQTQERPWLSGPAMSGVSLIVWCLGLIVILGVVAPLSYLWLAE